MTSPALSGAAQTIHSGAGTVERRRGLAQAQLEREYLAAPGRPVVLTDVAASWPALEKWTFAYFADEFGHTEIVACDNFLAPSRRVRTPLRKFLRYSQSGRAKSPRETKPLYCALQPFTADSVLMNDFAWPAMLENLYLSGTPCSYDWYLRTFGVVLIGPAGTVTPVHQDLFATHAFLVQITGRKHFEFWAPTPEAGLADAPAMETPLYEAVLHPGELIVFPQGWYHKVTALDPSISLTFNFVNRTNIMAHLYAIFHDLPVWLQRLNSPEARKAFSIGWNLAGLVAGA